MQAHPQPLKGRGALGNPAGRFELIARERADEFHESDAERVNPRSQVIGSGRHADAWSAEP